ncbi:MAG: sigma-70 family RNA polymerase sigma factor [Bacteroidota bacterium]
MAKSPAIVPLQEDIHVLLPSLQQGEEAAFKTLVESFQDRVYNTCLGVLRNAEDADDMAQEVFIEVYRSVNKFKEESSLATWIYRIAVNKSMELIRMRKRQKRFAWLTSLFGKEDLYGEKHADFVHPGVQLENQERSKILFDKIEDLPENQRVAFVLHKIEGLAYSEIADVMKLSVSSVESLMHRAKKNLKKWLEGYYRTEEI